MELPTPVYVPLLTTPKTDLLYISAFVNVTWYLSAAYCVTNDSFGTVGKPFQRKLLSNNDPCFALQPSLYAFSFQDDDPDFQILVD